MRRHSYSLLFAFILPLLLMVQSTQAESYPRDGRFKQLPAERDKWYFVDYDNWYIKAPDKWVHFMGSYALTEAGVQMVGSKTWAGFISLGLGMLKELDDAYREGWSQRDLYMDLGGVASSLFLPDHVLLLADYDDTTVRLRLTVILN